MKKPVKPLAELLDSVRDIDGFPIGTDEDILALSDPPYYTACPNPYINDFIEENGTPYDEETDDYHREPFVGDVSEGKNDLVYNAHSYHTKVPYKAIMKYIEHYTDEGDVVFDGFCGTGMTGVAAQMLNRKAILSDLSPIATFIAYNYNTRVDVNKFQREAERILEDVEKECGWMHETRPDDEAVKIYQKDNDITILPKKGKINYTVWSDVFVCPVCETDHIFTEAAVDKENGKVLKEYFCPECDALIKKTDCKRAQVSFFDKAIGKDVTQAKQVPVLINYTYGKKRFEKLPDVDDLALIERIESSDIPYWFPTDPIQKGDKTGEPLRIGITHVHHFYTKRNLWVLGCVFNKIDNNPEQIKRILLYTYEQAILGFSKLARYVPTHYSQVNQYLSGTLYIGSQIVEISLPYIIIGKIKRLVGAFGILSHNNIGNSIISVQAGGEIKNLKSNSIDYIFTDPPFGANLMYSELNFLWESWLKVSTNNKKEAIINRTQNKGLSDYAHLMTGSFKECFRILKPNRWITVEFHNSKSYIWNAIQDSLSKAGFVVSNVAVLDKKQGSFNQKFLEHAGEGLEEEFIKMHLAHLKPEPTVERTEQMLYSKLLAYYVQRSYTVKYDSSTFYKMLRENFVEEDSYWFNENQLDSYHEYKRKMKLEDIDEIRSGQQLLFIHDEKSSIIWLNSFLQEPKDFQEIHPAYTKIANVTGDNVPDIKGLLEKNFILENGKYRRPQSEDEKLSVVEKRERELQREFDTLLLEAKGSKKKIKECRKQAVIYGFEQCYRSNKFRDILLLASRLDKKIIENDSEIAEFIEVAEMKEEGF